MQEDKSRRQITLDSDSPKKSEKIGRILSEAVPDGTVIVFYAPMAAGKTAMSRGMFAARGFTEQFRSPSFTILNEYTRKQDDEKGYHFDMYRLEDEEELLYTGYEDCLEDGNLIVIEWAQRVENSLPGRNVKIRIEITGEERRRITITLPDDGLYEKVKEKFNESFGD